MVAGIVLSALGLKTTLAHIGEPLHSVPAAALLGGVALYLLAHVAFRWRLVRSLSRQRLVGAVVVAALFPVAVEVAALATLAVVVAVVCAVVAYEVVRFGETRRRVREEHGVGHAEERSMPG